MAKVAMLLGDEFEDSEFRVPYDALKQAGHDVQVLGEEKHQRVTGKRGHETVTIDDAVSDHSVQEYAALVIPGGHSPDHLRTHAPTVAFVHDFCESGKTVAAVCHGPQLLIEAAEVKGRVLTSWPSVRTDLLNAGAIWVDQEVVSDGFLITSRKPEDLKAFTARILEQIEATLQDSDLREEVLEADRQSKRSLTQ